MKRINGKLVIGDAINTPGDIAGGTPDIESNGNITLTRDQCRGQILYMTATGTVTLPPVIGDGLAITVYSTTAAAVHVDPNANDRIVLDGVALDNGDKISSASGAGDFVVLHNDDINGWRTLGRSGTWTDGG